MKAELLATAPLRLPSREVFAVKPGYLELDGLEDST